VVQPRTDSEAETEDVEGRLVMSSADEQVDGELNLAGQIL
jgi:hypothetical protein